MKNTTPVWHLSENQRWEKTWENYISRGFPEVLENIVENHTENYKNS